MSVSKDDGGGGGVGVHMYIFFGMRTRLVTRGGSLTFAYRTNEFRDATNQGRLVHFNELTPRSLKAAKIETCVYF
jgi:hypothetical protein